MNSSVYRVRQGTPEFLVYFVAKKYIFGWYGPRRNVVSYINLAFSAVVNY